VKNILKNVNIMSPCQVAVV